MLARRPEPELMTGEAQARAYAEADFSEPHSNVVGWLCRVFPSLPQKAEVADLGCGPADIAIRIAGLQPGFRIDAIDGSRAMLDYAAKAVEGAGLAGRVRLIQAVLPSASLPASHYDVVVSNSLLHHLHEPQVLWETIRHVAKPGARVFIADLKRPDSERAAAAMVERYAADEPEILQRDFYNSLLAAFTPREIEAQLGAAGLDLQIETISDWHLIVWGALAESGNAPAESTALLS